MKRAVIFDMDGVLIDSEHVHCNAWIKTFADHGIHLTQEQYHQEFSGKHSAHTVKELMKKNNKTCEDVDSVVFQKSKHAAQLMEDHLTPIPGVTELINLLHDNNYKLGLASSSGMYVVSCVLNSLHLESKFMVVHSGESVKRGKPNPDVYLQTAKLLEVEPENCVVIEDSKSGVIAATSAGMKCIALLNGRNKREDLKHAHYIAENFSEITEELIGSL